MEATPQAIGLRYMTDRVPGIRRKKRGRSFTYYDPGGKRISDKDEIARINALAIPPAYGDVWIAPSAQAHLQATGRDARGRKQYRYHKRWRAVREETKFERTIAFAHALAAIRAAVERDLDRPAFPREKVLAAVVWLLESTLIRVGNDEYAKENDSYGLTTLRSDHVRVVRDRMQFRFRGKSGIEHTVKVDDNRVARIVRGCKDLPGAEIFSYLDDDGTAVDVKSEDVNAYLREISGGEFTAKDFRTWAATVACAQSLALVTEAPQTVRDTKSALTQAIAQTAERLGNTPSVCRKSYIHPAVIERYLNDRKLELPAPRRTGGLSKAERAVLAFLEAAARQANIPIEKTLRASIARRAPKKRAA